MGEKSFYLRSTTGKNLVGEEWPAPEAKGVVALVHGLGEHCRRYERLADYFNDRQWAVMGFDQLGHGRSDGRRGHAPSTEALIADIALFVSEVSGRYPGIPLFLYGHSMGGNLALTYVLQQEPELAGLVVSSPWIKLAFEPPAWQVTLARLIRPILPALGQPTGLDPGYISRAPEEVAAYRNDPLIHDRITPATALGIMESGAWLMQFSGEAPVPILLMHGSGDRLTDFETTRALADRINGDLTFRAWEDYYHELHHEAKPEEVFDFVLQWLEERLQRSQG